MLCVKIKFWEVGGRILCVDRGILLRLVIVVGKCLVEKGKLLV